MLDLIIIVLVVMWLLGFFGPSFIPGIPRAGNLIHALLVIVLIIIVVRLL